ncbi:MAG TPA: phosphoribosylformylglycinamidine synthase subunit PurL [Dehalococcoidia bacterium]|nr:phosphoribosylformylglycinamidine synthase subunit PurL [Dehalococcoidia bacterium]
MPRDAETLALIALSVAEYEQIVGLLDREPNDVELGMFGAMWSEHCGYKNSKPLLRLFPSTGPQVLTTRGGENAGAVDIGGGYCVVFKVESHNHPSAIEPYEGAATGVGGIVRDIFAMGARPIALFDSLRFGPLAWGHKATAGGRGTDSDEARFAHNRSLFRGVVAGIGGYGNCLGVPTVGGEVSFSESYDGNPLVNAMCVGVARSDQLLRAVATGVGNPIILVGADTGRDGIGGANVLASRTFEAGQEELRPTVQVGNPFLEKLLMEACVELAERHGDWIVGLQDCGAAGLTSSLVECAARGDSGIDIDVALVPRRETGMTPAEVMLSESQERMIVIAKQEHEADVMAHFRRWEVHCDVIGQVTDDGIVRIRDGDEVCVRVRAQIFTDAPEYRRQGVKPRGLDELQTYDLAFLPDIVAWEEGPADANAALLQLLASPEITHKRWIWRQYDHQVLTNTVVGPGSDAAVLRIKQAAPRGIAVSTDGDSVKTYLDPFAGGAMAVAEATRNVACTGARPVAITDCLNFGNPERLDVYFQLEECIRGMAAACETLGVPVVSGNVSLYNESDGTAIYPTPVIGALGVLDDVSKAVPAGFQRAGDAVYLIGATTTREDGRELLPGDPIQLAGSEYLRQFHGKVAGSVRIDLACEARVQRWLVDAAADGLLRSAHDCSHGGLAVALAEACLLGTTGFASENLEIDARRDAALFGETASRVVVSVSPDHAGEVEALLERNEVPYSRLGVTGGDRLRIAGAIDAALTELRAAYESGLEQALSGEA